jgi:hypothetical protein
VLAVISMERPPGVEAGVTASAGTSRSIRLGGGEGVVEGSY